MMIIVIMMVVIAAAALAGRESAAQAVAESIARTGSRYARTPLGRIPAAQTIRVSARVVVVVTVIVVSAATALAGRVSATHAILVASAAVRSGSAGALLGGIATAQTVDISTGGVIRKRRTGHEKNAGGQAESQYFIASSIEGGDRAAPLPGRPSNRECNEVKTT